MTIVIKQAGPDVAVYVEEMGDQPRAFVRGVKLTIEDINDPLAFFERHKDNLEPVATGEARG